MPWQEYISHYTSANWRIPVKWEEIMSNITVTGEKNTWEMQSILHYPHCINMHLPGRREKKWQGCYKDSPHWSWPNSQDVKTCLYLQLPVAPQPLWDGDHVSSLLVKWKRVTENKNNPWPSFFGGDGVLWAILTFGGLINQPQTPESHGVQEWNHLLHYFP